MLFMSFTTSYRFYDGSDLPQDIAKFFLGWMAKKGLDYLWSRHSWRLNTAKIKRKFEWFKIGCHMISLLIFGTLKESFNKIHIKQLNFLFDTIIFFNVMSGTRIFMRLEPKVVIEFGRLWEAHMTQEKLEKITGVTTKIDDLLF